ncbi:MAG TPA: hypothetical protein VMS60_15750 [Solirubrobacterales bacterium]|nr:hypothetical protein [Solirubrobacterales bacterium]
MPKPASEYALPKAGINPVDYLRSQGAIDDFCVGSFGTTTSDPAERERVGAGLQLIANNFRVGQGDLMSTRRRR